MVNRHRLALANLVFLALVFAGELPLPAALVTHTDRAQFLAEAGGPLPTEDFEIVGLPGTGQILASLDASTNAPPVVPGSILAGVQFRSEEYSVAYSVFLVPSGFELDHDASTKSSMLFTLVKEKPLILDFAAGVSAVGLDLFGWAAAPGLPVQMNWSVNRGSQTGTLTVPAGQFEAGGKPVFFGLTSSAVGGIRRLQLTPVGVNHQPFVAVDNVMFGGDPAGLAVPEPGSLIAWCLFGGTLLIGSRRRKRTS